MDVEQMNENFTPEHHLNSPMEDLGSEHPTNHYKFCPRCAAPGSFDREQFSFKCPQCGMHFFLNSAAAVTALIHNSNNELLLVRRGVEPSIGMLDLPGGFVDPGESAETALLRELKEELNVVPDSFSYYVSFPNQYRFSGTTVFTIDLVFKCRVNDFSTLKYMDDVQGIEFIKPEEINLHQIPFLSVKNLLIQLNNERKNN